MRNILATLFLFSITLCSYSQQSSNNGASILMQQHKMEIPVITKNIILFTSFNPNPEEIINNNEDFISIGAITSFLSSENFIYILVLSFLGFLLLYRLFRKD
jgi:hypothetical protein|tara:strand:- start:582 stop:887 length:306 start_codon:yes stop_codon:yes gene_type:complete